MIPGRGVGSSGIGSTTEGLETGQPRGRSAGYTDQVPIKTLDTKASQAGNALCASSRNVARKVTVAGDSTRRTLLRAPLPSAGFNLCPFAVINHNCEYTSFQRVLRVLLGKLSSLRVVLGTLNSAVVVRRQGGL